MPLPIEDYAFLSDCQAGALVGKDGSIDWACFPRFDSDACFAALLGGPEHGRWRIAPRGEVSRTERRYRPGTLVLETDFTVAGGGRVRVIDFMTQRQKNPDIVRIVEGLDGRVEMELELTARFGYGRARPMVRRAGDVFVVVCGADALAVRAGVELTADGSDLGARFVVEPGRRVGFTITWHPSFHPLPHAERPDHALDETESWWGEWSGRARYEGAWRDEVLSSLVTLKGLIYEPTGGIVAAPTTSLPEHVGSVRNWDYRFCWLRDATFTLYALMVAGYVDEAGAWRDWVLRAIAGHPAELQIMYGPAGERRLPELELPWLPGYLGSSPVRIGNAAVDQLQLDVYGELMDCLDLARRSGLAVDEATWQLERGLVDFVEEAWARPDEGIWEVRSGRRDFTHSKVMAWVAVDRAIRAVEAGGVDGPVDRWRALRARIHDEVCRRGFDASRGTFTQAFGAPELDASLLLIPLVGFLPASDARVAGTLRAIERELLHEGFVRRYGEGTNDGLPQGEGVFLPCTFWYACNLEMAGRHGEAHALFDRLLALRNDVGLLSEEYDPAAPVGRRFLGNFPQAFTHVSLVNTACSLAHDSGPVFDRSGSSRPRG